MIVRRIDALGPEDRAALVELLIAVVDDGASVGFLPPLARDEADAYFGDFTSPSDVVLLVAEDGDGICGTVQLQPSPKANGRHRAEIAKLLVHPRARRRGIGRLLMREAEAGALRLGRTLLVLDTREGDVSNALYRSMGYVEAGRIPRYAQSANGALDASVFYFKELA